MASVFDVRRENLRRLIRQLGGPTTLAKQLGYSNGSYVAQLAGPHPVRRVGETVARQIEHVLDLPEHWLDHPHKVPHGERTALFIDAVNAARRELDAQRVALAKERFADLVELVAERAEEEGHIDQHYLHRLVKLMK